MKLSIKIKIDDKKLSEFTPNPIYEYAELIEIFREHGFVHRTQMDSGFINDDATIELAEKAISDARERLWWLDVKNIITDCFVEEIGETTDLLAQGKIKKSK